MSYKDEIKLIREGLISIFVNELKEIKKLIPLCNNKKELINKMKEIDLNETFASYYIKDIDFENIIPKINLLLVESEDK